MPFFHLLFAVHLTKHMSSESSESSQSSQSYRSSWSSWPCGHSGAARLVDGAHRVQRVDGRGPLPDGQHLHTRREVNVIAQHSMTRNY